MSNYDLEKELVAEPLDELGLRLGMVRLPGESLDNYRKRLILESKDRQAPNLQHTVDSASREVGLFEKRIFKISLVRDSEGIPVAEDPFIQVSGSHLRIYDNYREKSVAVELNLYNRDEHYFLIDVYNAIKDIDWIEVETLEEDWEYLKSWSLKVCSSMKVVQNQTMDIRGGLQKLDNEDIRDVSFSARATYKTLVDSEEDIAGAGDYFVDKINGLIWSHSKGSGICSYTHRDFPFFLWWQPVNVLELNDIDIDYITKDVLISDSTGKEENLLLNPYGAKVANELLSAYPLYWGN